MVRMTPSQFNSWLRQQQQKQRDAVRRHNQEVDRVNRANRAAAAKAIREHNREVDRVNQHNKRAADHNKRVIENVNRQIRQHNQSQKAAIAKYNQAVRAHNSKVEQGRIRRISALRALTRTHHSEVRDSSFELSLRFESVERQARSASRLGDLLDLTGREAANSAEVAYALNADEPQAPEVDQDTGILEYLAGFSQDLCDRWRGALYSLNPDNPDAGRHFCSSVREIFTEILDGWAVDDEVIASDPNFDRTPNGTPSRRAKIRYLLRKKGADSPEMLGFVEKDIDDILQLFPILNSATHGAAGKFELTRLQHIRQRVEGGIMFLAAIAL
jgi:hypothetical protein